MKSIYIELITGFTIMTHGEAKLDPIENSVVIDGEGGTTTRFYWPNVAMWAESEYDPDASDE